MRVNAVFFADRVRGAVLAVPVRDTDHFALEQFNEPDCGILSDISETLDGSGTLRAVQLEMFHCLADVIHHAISGGFGAAQRSPAAHRFAGNHAGSIFPAQGGIFIHHPSHHLWGCAHIGGRYVVAWTNIFPDLFHISAHQPLFFTDGKGGRVNNHAAFTASQRDVCNSTLPGHPHGQSAHGVRSLGGMKPQSAFMRSAGIIVLHPETFENADRSIIHSDGDSEVIFTERPAQKFSDLRV